MFFILTIVDCYCKNQMVDRNIRIVACWWTLCKNHLLRPYFGIFQPSVVFSHRECHLGILENIQISKTSKELLDRVGGFRCERRGIIDLPVSIYLRYWHNIEIIEKHWKYRHDIENIENHWKHWQNVENIDKTLQNIDKTLKILKTLLFCLWVICKQIMFRDIAYHESAIEVIKCKHWEH